MNCRNKPGGLRTPYMGHLIRMANYIVEFGKQGKNATKIQHLIEEDIPEAIRSRWSEFVDSKLAPANQNNEIIPVQVKFSSNKWSRG